MHGGLLLGVQRLHRVDLDRVGRGQAQMSSSTFSRSLLKLLFTVRPSMSTQSDFRRLLVGTADGDLLDAEDAEGRLSIVLRVFSPAALGVQFAPILTLMPVKTRSFFCPSGGLPGCR